MTRNVGEKPKPNQGLFESERRFRLLVEGVIDYAICMLDPTGLVTNWNAGARRIKGYEQAEIIGKHFSIFYTEEERAAGKPAHALETARREGRFGVEGWRVRKDGRRYLASVVIDAIYEEGELIGFAKITRDISERQAARQALQDSERRFKLLVSSVTDYALYMLDEKGHVSSWNAGGKAIKGYLPSEIIGQHFSRFYTESDRKAGRPERALAIARETGRYEEEGRRVRKDGSFFWASVIIHAIRDDNGNVIGFAKVTRDITERRNAQAALEQVQKQLAESQKMDALGQLTGGIAHDLNNLLMIVSGNLPKLKELSSSDPKGRRAAEAIEVATQRGASLTRQLLTFSRRQRLAPEPINLQDRFVAIRDLLTTALGGKVALTIDIGPEVWPVIADVSEFEVAMVNLIVNARDAMPEGGVVAIHAANSSLTEGVTLPGEYVAICVEDSGVGIPPDILSRVFDPFFTTKEIGKGTGLGLSQVHGFAHQAGGTVKVESVLARGTKVTIYLPRASAGRYVSASQKIEAERVAHGGRVLVVDDNPDVANATSSILEQLGYTVRCAPDARSALHETERELFDLVLSDIVMAGPMDGLGLARELRKRHPRLPILLATGYSDAAQDAGNEFTIIRKPYDQSLLSRAISSLTP